MVYLGSDHVLEQASETLEKLLGIKVSAKQFERVSEHIGQIIEDEQVTTGITYEGQPFPIKETCTTDYHYVEMDGSMIFTREEKWKEMVATR